MNKLVSCGVNSGKYLGFHRPGIFKPNAFLFFYTSNPTKYIETVGKSISELNNKNFYEIAEMNGFRCVTETYIADKIYSDYKLIHNTIVDQFGKTKKHTNQNNNIRNWPVIYLDKNQMSQLFKTDELIKNLLETSIKNRLIVNPLTG